MNLDTGELLAVKQLEYMETDDNVRPLSAHYLYGII